jgi:hypothetical protein
LRRPVDEIRPALFGPHSSHNFGHRVKHLNDRSVSGSACVAVFESDAVSGHGGTMMGQFALTGDGRAWRGASGVILAIALYLTGVTNPPFK